MKKLLAIMASLTLGACAAATSGSTQNVTIITTPARGAACKLVNDNSSWEVKSTPESVMVHREASDLVVTCSKGELSGSANVVSVTRDLAFGNILAGGLIGVAVDRGNGAAFEYPSTITVPMAVGGKHTTIEPPPPPASQTDNGSRGSRR